MKTNDSEIGGMEAPERSVSHTESTISEHMENVSTYNDSDLPPRPHHRGGVGITIVGGGLGIRSYVYIYIYIYVYIYINIYIYIYICNMKYNTEFWASGMRGARKSSASAKDAWRF